MLFSLYSEKLKGSLRKRGRGGKGERWRKQEKKKKNFYLLQTANHSKKKHIQMAQEIVVNYDEAQRDKSTPDYSVHGAKRETKNKRGRLDRTVEMTLRNILASPKKRRKKKMNLIIPS